MTEKIRRGSAMNVAIAQKLADLRRARGFSQESLAAELGLSRQAISKWERAESAPDMGNLITLSDLYGVTIDELLRVDADIADDMAFESQDLLQEEALEDAVLEQAVLEDAIMECEEASQERAGDGEESAAPETVTYAAVGEVSSSAAPESPEIPSPSMPPTPFESCGPAPTFGSAPVSGTPSEDSPFPWQTSVSQSVPQSAAQPAGQSADQYATHGAPQPTPQPTPQSAPQGSAPFAPPQPPEPGVAPAGKPTQWSLLTFPYPLFCVVAYLVVGFMFGWWHPAWIIFLTIPFWFWIVNTIKADPLYQAYCRERQAEAEALLNEELR